MRIVMIIILLAQSFIFCRGTIESLRRDQVTKAPQSSNITLTQIISDPPGAKIEINHEYVGETPLSIQIRADKSWWNGKITEDLIIVA